MPKEIKYEGKYLRIVQHDHWEYVERINCDRIAYIIPVLTIDGAEFIVFIREFRIPLQKYVISCPAGLVGDKQEESLEEGALRELVEETGYSGDIHYVTHGPPTAGLTNEVIHFYVADNLKKVSYTLGDGTEDISLETIPLNMAKEWLDSYAKRSDYLVDPKVYVGLYFVTNAYK